MKISTKKFNFSAGFNKILANTGFLFGERILNMVLSLVVGIYVARYLGPKDYGLLSYAQSMGALFMAISSLGATNIVIRDLVKNAAEKQGMILGTTFILMLGAGIISAIMVIVLGLWINKSPVTNWLIVIISANLILQAFQTFDYWFQSKVLSKYSSYARTSGQIVSSLLKVFFVLLGTSVIPFAVAIISAGIISGIVWIFSYNRKNEKKSKWSFNADYAKRLLKDAWPLILSGLSIAIYMNIDQVMIKNLLDANAVGNYAVAVKISVLWYFIPMAITSSVFPSIIFSKRESEEKYYRRLQYLYDIMAGLALVIALPMTFLSGIVIHLLFGEKYILAGSVLSVHIWAGVFVFVGVVRGKWIINENFQHYAMIFTVSGAIINTVLNLWLIPKIGIMGAAWATLISQALSSWILGFFIPKIRSSSKMILKSIFSAILIYPVYHSIKMVLKEASE